MRMRVIGVVLIGALLAGCSSSSSTLPSHPVSFSARPVLCYAARYAPAAGTTTSAPSTLPACGAAYQLTAARLDVKVNPSTYAGYTASLAQPADPQFAPIPSTADSASMPEANVLLGAAPTAGTKDRFVLGPAVVTRESVHAAVAYDEAGIWVDNVVFTSQGTTAWDAFARSHFHQLVAFVVGNDVLVATVIEPTQKRYSSPGGAIQIDAGLSEGAAKQLAADLT